MPTAEIAPAPIPETSDLSAERFPHMAVPGFNKLSPERQHVYSEIPPDKFHLVRSALEKEIAEVSETREEDERSDTEDYQASTIETKAIPRRDQANTAIDTYHRAESGDPEAKKDLLDAKKELLGKEPSDDDIFKTILEDQGGVFDNSLVLDVALSDTETQQHQDVLDMFKEFRGDLASVDAAIKPKQQIDLFIELTKGQGDLAERLHFARKALTVLTASGERSLFVGLSNMHVLSGDEIVPSGVKALRKMADAPIVIPNQT